MAFNRNRNSSRPRPSFGGKPRFNDRGSDREPVEMHKAVCDNCDRECEVPFRPTSGKPVYCSNCFGDKKSARENTGGRNGFAEINAKLDNILMLLENKKEE